MAVSVQYAIACTVKSRCCDEHHTNYQINIIIGRQKIKTKYTVVK